MRDEDVREIAVALQADEQVEDGGLNGNVERRRRLVAYDEVRFARKRTRDADALLETARQLARQRIQQPGVETNRLRQLDDAARPPLAAHAGQLGQGSTQDLAHALSSVKRCVRILKHDLDGTDLVQAALPDPGRQLLPLEVDLAPGVGHAEPDHAAGERRLAAARLADQPEHLAGRDLEVDACQGLERVALLRHRPTEVLDRQRRAGRLRDRRPLHHVPLGPRQRLSDVGEVAPTGMSLAHRVEAGFIYPADVLHQPAAVGEDAGFDRRTDPGREAGNGVQRSHLLAEAPTGDAPQQADRVRVARVGEQLPRRALFHHAAGIQNPDPIAHARNDSEVVADEQHARPEGGAQIADQVQDLGLDRGIESRRRLVEDEQGRVRGKGHGDDHTLLHAARELVRIPAHHPLRVGDLDAAQHRQGPLARLALGHTGDHERLDELVPGTNRRVQGGAGILVDHRRRRRAQLAQIVVVHVEHVLAVEDDRSACDLRVVGQVAHDGVRDR